MTEFIINSEQLERLIEAIEHKTGREINRMVIDGKRATEIVRCRDCKRCMAYAKAAYCDRFAHELPGATLDGFCAWGERRDA